MTDIRRLPFASYDLVVYFGVGILALPFLRLYVARPLQLQVPAEALIFAGSPFVNAAVLTLLVLFSGYALGHVIALFSSYFIEQFVRTWLGYPSEVWLDTSKHCGGNPGSLTETDRRALILKRVRSTRLRRHSIVVTAFHFPLTHVYVFIWFTRWFDFYFSKLPCELYHPLIQRIREVGIPAELLTSSAWPKVLKQYVVNNCPVAYSRMSNHRVVFGLLRSLAFLALMAAWVELALSVAAIWTEEVDLIRHLIAWLLFAGAAAFLLVGFAKFNRRFFEEAVYAFLLSRVKAEAG